MMDSSIWIRDTGASTHMTNSDQGMFEYKAIKNQFVNVESGEKLEVKKKGKKRCVIEQMNGTKTHIVLTNVNFVPMLT